MVLVYLVRQKGIDLCLKEKLTKSQEDGVEISSANKQQSFPHMYEIVQCELVIMKAIELIGNPFLVDNRKCYNKG